MPSSKPSKTIYQHLLNDIAAIHDKAMRDLGTAFNSIFKSAYWEIGKRIVEVDQKSEANAPYGKHLIENISRDMTAMNRKGFSETNLRNMRRVYTAFPIQQISAELGWSHYVVLSSIQDAKTRQAYTKKAIQKNWDVNALKATLQKDNVALSVVDAGESKALPPPKDVNIIRLAVKRGILNLYKVVEPLDEDLKKDSFWVDCGFFVYHKFVVGAPRHGGVPLQNPAGPLPKPGEVVAIAETPEGYAFKRFEEKDIAPKSVLYTYAARVMKVIDADTITVLADLGFDLLSKQKLRLRKINAPEISTAAGKKAREFVVKKMKQCRQVVIKTYSTDIYDRYLVDVFYLPGCDDAQKITREGILLNQELIDEGLADLWQKPDPDELAFLN